MLRARQLLSEQANQGTVTKEYIDNLIAIKSQGADIARKLQSLSIGADPKAITAKQAILEAVLKANKNADDVIAAAKGVDFNDLKLVLSNWLGLGSCATFVCDLNSDAKINAIDASLVIANWGR